MKNQFELLIRPDGSLETIYQDGLAEELGAQAVMVQRASLVEWEADEGACAGWTVRSAHHHAKAIRWTKAMPSFLGTEFGTYVAAMKVDTSGSIVVFKTREDALKAEEHFFWELIKHGPCDTSSGD